MAKEYSIGLYEKAMPDTLSWKEKFLAAKEAGYDFYLQIISNFYRKPKITSC